MHRLCLNCSDSLYQMNHIIYILFLYPFGADLSKETAFGCKLRRFSMYLFLEADRYMSLIHSGMASLSLSFHSFRLPGPVIFIKDGLGDGSQGLFLLGKFFGRCTQERVPWHALTCPPEMASGLLPQLTAQLPEDEGTTTAAHVWWPSYSPRDSDQCPRHIYMKKVSFIHLCLPAYSLTDHCSWRFGQSKSAWVSFLNKSTFYYCVA